MLVVVPPDIVVATILTVVDAVAIIFCDIVSIFVINYQNEGFGLF